MDRTNLKRIEAALSRIEAATALPRETTGGEVAVRELQERHEILRTETKTAIGEINALIAGIS